MSAKNYETMVVFSVANGDEAVQALVEKFKAMIEAELGGTVSKHLAKADSPEVVIEE